MSMTSQEFEEWLAHEMTEEELKEYTKIDTRFDTTVIPDEE